MGSAARVMPRAAMPVGRFAETGGMADPDEAVAFAGLPRLRISIGEVSAQPVPTLLKTLLGSCVAVCLYDPASGAGGMNHIFLPGDAPGGSATHGVHAMELLINSLMRLGCGRRNLLAKAFGAANVLPCLKSPTVGERNAQFVREFLQDERIPLVAQRLGGASAMDVRFRTDTGYVLLRTLNAVQGNALERAEQRVQQALARAKQAEDDVTLF